MKDKSILDKYWNPDGTFNQKLYHEDEVKNLCRNNMVSGVVLNKGLTEVHMVSGRILRYKMKLDV